MRLARGRGRRHRRAGRRGADPGPASFYPRLDSRWLLIADRNFYNWADWTRAADTGAALLWRVKSTLLLPVLTTLPHGSHTALLVNPAIKGKARTALIETARAGEPVDHEQARIVRVIEYQVPDREGDETGELICLITTILEHGVVPAMTNSPPTSPPSATSIPSAGTAPTPAWSNAPATTPTGSNARATPAPATTGPPPSNSSTPPDPRSMITLR
ncbi:hypothetical protein [Actinomadura sp. BRA 177]|uniref:hypothetical protein n=1 Tax=Actinomadura sp. BRA 177 TaxID=2745202 RepID=UPI001594F9C1|nr:hypothetical protein [Actinomadura sp. BRA 177]NVI89406.1 hypothetical protein [Actinomadura sp. BRA 177]